MLTIVVTCIIKEHRGGRTFAVIAPELWNELPLYVRPAPALHSSGLTAFIMLLSFCLLNAVWSHLWSSFWI